MARLIFKRGEHTLLEFKLPGGRTLIGRSDACDLVVPGESVSRTHCILTGRDGTWSVRDRSRHGTRVDGQPIDSSWALEEGQVIEVGDFRLEFTYEDGDFAPTASRVGRGVPAEQLVAADHGLELERAVLVVEGGPDSGRRLPLSRARQTLGGPGSDVVLSDPSLLPAHLELRLVRGRAILHPGRGAAIVDGERVAVPIPVYLGEPVRAGDTTFRLEMESVRGNDEAESFGEMVGVSASSRRVFGVLRRMAVHNAPVLLLGESGTGKELAARGLHEESPRAGAPFVAVNCGAIADNLFESELFGHEKGSFTGATERRDGAFHSAAGGTLMLDEVGELPEAAQAKLLRALESGEVRRVGSANVSYPDVRVVAATNRDLQDEVAAGRFRGDLFFRLAVLAVRLPPLRDRMEDLEVIARKLAGQLGPEVIVTDDAINALKSHSFAGNARELRNVLTRAYVMGGPRISAATVSFNPWSYEIAEPEADDSGDMLEIAERQLLIECFHRHNGNNSAMARELGIARSTLHYKLKRFGIGV